MPSGDLRDARALHFQIYAENPNLGFQSGSPWIRLQDGVGNFVEYQYCRGGAPYDLLNEARDRWQTYDIPLAGVPDGVDGWRRTLQGAPIFADIQSLEIHADTWDSGFTLWFDGMDFDRSWQNRGNPNDVDGNGPVTPLDVLTVISAINARPGETFLTGAPPMVPPYVDVSDDGLLTPMDVLLVIAYLNSHPSGSSEAEAAPWVNLTPVAGTASALAAARPVGSPPAAGHVRPTASTGPGVPRVPDGREIPVPGVSPARPRPAAPTADSPVRRARSVSILDDLILDDLDEGLMPWESVLPDSARPIGVPSRTVLAT